MKKILIVYYSLGGNTRAAAMAVKSGAQQVEGVDVIVKNGLEATVEDLLSCDAAAFGSPDFFSYIAGGLKDFFDRTYYPTKGKVEGKPCVAFITHGGGGKAVASLQSILRAFKMKEVVEPVLVKNRPEGEDEKKLVEAGRRLSELAVAG